MPYEFFEAGHAIFAVAALGMNGRVIEENAIASGFELLANDEMFIGPPIRIVHTSGLIRGSVPGGQGSAGLVLLEPMRGRMMELLAEFGRPMFIEGIEADD